MLNGMDSLNLSRQLIRLKSALAVEALTGRRSRKQLKPSLLKQAAYQAFADESWLFDECYAAVGDLSETLAILFANQDAVSQTDQPILDHWRQRQHALSQQKPEVLISELPSLLNTLSRDEAFLFLKLSSGGFRVGVSKGLVMKQLRVPLIWTVRSSRNG